MKPGSIEALQARLNAIPERVREAVKPALLKSGKELQTFARALAPEDTGALKESIAVTPPGETTPAYSQPGGSRVAGELEVLVTVGNAEVRYPHLVEFGTAHAPAQPFLFPSLRLLKDRFRNRAKRAIKGAVKADRAASSGDEA